MSWKITLLIGLCVGGILGVESYSFLMKCDRELRAELPHGFVRVENPKIEQGLEVTTNSKTLGLDTFRPQ